MALLPWPQTAWLLAGLVVLASPAIGVLWAPGIAMLSDGAEAHGIEQAIAFALVNLGWAVGDALGGGGARLAEARAATTCRTCCSRCLRGHAAGLLRLPMARERSGHSGPMATTPPRSAIASSSRSASASWARGGARRHRRRPRARPRGRLESGVGVVFLSLAAVVGIPGSS